MMFNALADALQRFLSNASGNTAVCRLEPVVPAGERSPVVSGDGPTAAHWIARFRLSASQRVPQAHSETPAPPEAPSQEFVGAEVIATVVGGLATGNSGERHGLAERMLLVTIRQASTPREVATAVLNIPQAPSAYSSDDVMAVLAEASSRFLAALTAQLSGRISFTASTAHPSRSSQPSGGGARDLPRAAVIFGVTNSAPRNPDLTPAGGDGGFARSGGVPVGYGVGGGGGGIASPEGMWFGANNPLFQGGGGGAGGVSPLAPGGAAAAFARFDPIFPEGGSNRGAGGGAMWPPGSSSGAPAFPGEPNPDHLRPLNNDGLPPPRGPFSGFGASRGGGGKFQYGW